MDKPWSLMGYEETEEQRIRRNKAIELTSRVEDSSDPESENFLDFKRAVTDYVVVGQVKLDSRGNSAPPQIGLLLAQAEIYRRAGYQLWLEWYQEIMDDAWDYAENEDLEGEFAEAQATLNREWLIQIYGSHASQDQLDQLSEMTDQDLWDAALQLLESAGESNPEAFLDDQGLFGFWATNMEEDTSPD